MKSLRIRMVVAFLATALVPMGIVGWFAHEDVAQRTRVEHGRRIVELATLVRERLTEQQNDDARALRLLCQEDLLVAQITVDASTHRLTVPAGGELGGMVQRVMASLGLDALVVLDATAGGHNEGRILAAAGLLDRAGMHRDRTLLNDMSRGYGSSVFRSVDARGGRTVPMLLQSCFAERDDVRLLVVAGRALDQRFLSSLERAARPVRVALTEGRDEAPPAGDPASQYDAVYVLHDSARQPVARLWAVMDPSSLQAQLRRLDQGFVFGGIAAVVLGVGLALFLSLRVLRPLRDLEHAAARVAAGDLESSIATHRTGGEAERTLTAFNRMTQELRTTRERLLRAERIAAWRDIARRIAHEVKNPLSPIQVSIETMRKTYANQHPDFDEIFEESTLAILEEVERLKRIVTEFSQFARLPRPRAEPLDLRDAIEHVRSLHPEATVEIDDDIPIVRADKEQIAQVLMNLLQNAADAARARHGDSGGIVRVEARREPGGSGVTIRVHDNGPGVPSELKARIFDPYFTTKAGGTGLGLAIVHRIVSDHGGHVEVTDAPSGGATFEVLLPIDGPPPEADASLTDTVVPLMRKR